MYVNLLICLIENARGLWRLQIQMQSCNMQIQMQSCNIH